MEANLKYVHIMTPLLRLLNSWNEVPSEEADFRTPEPKRLKPCDGMRKVQLRAEHST